MVICCSSSKKQVQIYNEKCERILGHHFLNAAGQTSSFLEMAEISIKCSVQALFSTKGPGFITEKLLQGAQFLQGSVERFGLNLMILVDCWVWGLRVVQEEVRMRNFWFVPPWDVLFYGNECFCLNSICMQISVFSNPMGDWLPNRWELGGL